MLLTALSALTLVLQASSHGDPTRNPPSPNPPSPCELTTSRFLFEYEYFQSGDISIGGLFSAHMKTTEVDYLDAPSRWGDMCEGWRVKNSRAHPNTGERICGPQVFLSPQLFPLFIEPFTKYLEDWLWQITKEQHPPGFQLDMNEYRSILVFIFAIKEINKSMKLLPNITLGYHIYNSCGETKKTINYVLQILSGVKEAPNYNCRKRGEIAGFIGDYSFQATKAMAQLLGLYRYTHVSYSFTEPSLSDRQTYPHFYHTVPNDRIHYAALIKFLLHFGWNLVGIILTNDATGDAEERLKKALTHHGICAEYVILLSNVIKDFRWASKVLKHTLSTVILICGEFYKEYTYFIHHLDLFKGHATLIFHKLWTLLEPMKEFFPSMNCSFSFSLPTKPIPGLKAFIEAENPSNLPNDPFLEDLSILHCDCLSDNPGKNLYFQQIYDIVPENCNRICNISYTTYFGHYYVYIAVYALANALHAMNPNMEFPLKLNNRLHKYMKKLHYEAPMGNDVMFNERGELSSDLYLYNLVFYQDSEKCHKCPDEKWADTKRVICIPKTFEFLSYENDVLVLFFLFASLLFSVITLFIFGVFIFYWDTPTVKANNRTVSFILLTSILLSFLCVFFFLGRPVDITCMLRQSSFGVFFSIAVSSVLAKTITVCIAFKASKPGSYWRKWVGFKVAHFVVLMCSSAQVLICVIWLSVSPPYQEYDMDSYPGKILIQCNEGSVIGFYSMLGYMGFLAAVSFVLAFMVRTLPDSFNEAKYITFSMLVFCSVWIAMIPAYLSTRGKYMVAVEIFAILTSSAGVLSCIFFPKMYILLINPDLNSRKHILHIEFL
ncbi:vomeronasal type-2 receptor 26-like [Lithobates pipiens]